MNSTTPVSRIDDPSIWLGEELFSRNDWEVNLGLGEVSELSHAAHSVETLDLEKISPKQFSLPTLSTKLHSIRDSLESGSGATVIRGLPIRDFSPGHIEKIFVGICSYLGTPVSQSAKGELIFHVRDAGLVDDDPRARGPNTKKRLSFHTDRCDVIGFLCVNKAKSGGENFLVHSMAVYNHILETRPDLLNVLLQPFHYMRHTVDTANQHPFCRQPVFSFTEGHFACSFLRVLIDRAHRSSDVPDLTSQQTEALDYLETVCENPSMHVRFFQEPGDMMFLNNWTTLHRRSEFVDHKRSDMKRHLLRAWLSMPNSRPIDPLFKENFGATEAGAIRGGMPAAT